METQTTEAVTFEQRVERLAKHLLRAGKGQKAAILFAVYRSEFARAEAEKKLEAKLHEAGEKIVRVRVQSEGETIDLPRYLRNHPQKGQAIFFIYDIARGGDATQQYLNYRREYLVEDQQRLVFWLHENEIGPLARNAPDFWAFRGRTLEFLEQPPQQLQEQLADDLAYYNWRGDSSQDIEDLETGIRMREQLLAELPDLPEFNQSRAEILYTLAAQYRMADEPDKALQLYGALEKLIDPNDIYFLARFLNSRGNTYYVQDNLRAALDDYEEAIRLNPEDDTTYNNLGLAYHEQGNFAGALTNYELAIRLNPENPTIYFNRGNTYSAQGNFIAAIEDYSQAILLNPEFAIAYNNRGLVYHELKNYDAALADFSETIRLNPEDTKALYNRGRTYRAQGKFMEALAEFRKVVQKNPESAEPYLNLALLYMDMNKPEDTLRHLKYGLELNKNYQQEAAEDATFEPLRDNPRFRALVGLDVDNEEA